MDKIPPETPSELIFHVLPVDDLRDHSGDCDKPCWCHPAVQEVEGGYLIVHNSMDGRELIERGERRTQ